MSVIYSCIVVVRTACPPLCTFTTSSTMLPLIELASSMLQRCARYVFHIARRTDNVHDSIKVVYFAPGLIFEILLATVDGGHFISPFLAHWKIIQC